MVPPEEPVAQPVEHLTFNQRVSGSNPDGLTNILKDLARIALAYPLRKVTSKVTLAQ